MEINERLQAVMRYKNLTGKDLAEKLHVQRSAISHLLSGRNKPSIDFLEKFIIQFPDINIQWFISGKGDMLNQKTNTENTPTTNTKQPKELNLFEFTNVTSKKSSPLQVNSEDSIKYRAAKSNESAIPAEIDDNKIDRIILIYSDGTFDTLITRKK